MNTRFAFAGTLILLVVLISAVWRFWGMRKPLGATHTVESRLAEFGEQARARLEPFFSEAGVPYPGDSVTLVAVKDARRLELYAAPSGGTPRHIRDYTILGASGGPGPKLLEGDRQVPEGIYGVELLNPNSRFHVSLRVNYPNAQDRVWAEREGRQRPGSDIMIHGSDASIGCLAMGDLVAEELFTLAALVGCAKVRLLFCPTDFRSNPGFAPPAGAPEWVSALYEELRAAVQRLTHGSVQGTSGL